MMLNCDKFFWGAIFRFAEGAGTESRAAEPGVEILRKQNTTPYP
jgi:hypothetical protein